MATPFIFPVTASQFRLQGETQFHDNYLFADASDLELWPGVFPDVLVLDGVAYPRTEIRRDRDGDVNSVQYDNVAGPYNHIVLYND